MRLTRTAVGGDLVLPPDLVRARRRGDKLQLIPLSAGDRERAEELSQELVDTLRQLIGSTEEEVELVLDGVGRLPGDEKLFLGLAKLAKDQCAFGARTEVDPVALRRALFEQASAARAALPEQGGLDVGLVMQQVADSFGLEAPDLSVAMFSDLKGAQELRSGPTSGPRELVERYEQAQIQGIFLRATQVVVEVRGASPEDYRALFRAIKFRQLLCRIDHIEGGYRLEIAGPFHVIEASTRYGLELALLVPVLRRSGHVRVRAQLLWGKEKRSLEWSSEWSHATGATVDPGEADVRPELRAALDAPAFRDSGWVPHWEAQLLAVPGVGVCVPDVVFRKPGHPDVAFELLGYWSRDAVWRRVEWAEAAPEFRVVFGVSARLRVSEEALPEEARASLLVYKATLSARRLVEAVERCANK